MNSKDEYFLYAEESTLHSPHFSSPSTFRQFKNPLSFANIHPNHPNHHCAKSPKCKSSLSQKENMVSPFKSGSKKVKQVIEGYEVQNRSLKGTVKILQEQIEGMSESYRKMKEKNKKLKREMEEKEKCCQKKLEKMEEYRQKSEEYDELIPKIEELQILQDSVVQENKALKGRENDLRETMASILVLIGNSQNESLAKIRKLLRGACSNDPHQKYQ